MEAQEDNIGGFRSPPLGEGNDEGLRTACDHNEIDWGKEQKGWRQMVVRGPPLASLKQLGFQSLEATPQTGSMVTSEELCSETLLEEGRILLTRGLEWVICSHSKMKSILESEGSGETVYLCALSLVMTKKFIVLETGVVGAAIASGLFLRTDVVTIAWAGFFASLLISGGRFYKQLDAMLGWPSIFLFVFMWSLPPLVSRSLWPTGIFPYFVGFFLAKWIDDDEPTDVRKAARLTQFFFFYISLR